MPKPKDATLAILRSIRDEIIHTRAEITETRLELSARIDQTNSRIDQTNVRVEKLEHVLLELAEQQRFMVRHFTPLASCDRAIEQDVDDLKARVGAIEQRLPPT
ncbi:MAG: hypothetical protein K8H88_24725 [Sandaracinaceae bacterium]|nr:hypothetical protein [Sandaracinaceae bacterium]